MNNKTINLIKEWIIPIVIAIILGLCINKFLIYKIYVPTSSMYPTIEEHTHIMTTRIYNLDKLERGDVIVFDSKELNDTLIKRLIGLPGDKISIENGQVTVNGEVLQEDYVKNNDINYEGDFEVPEGKYFFLGDNRSNSKDSRYWKDPYVSGEDIKGKAVFTIYPFKNFGLMK